MDLRVRLAARGHEVDSEQLDDTIAGLAGLGLLEEPPAAAALGEIAAERYDRQLAYFADLRQKMDAAGVTRTPLH